jgi:PAS domain S-box-containing protein/putative nucleotidyltransferase with HDIG domain
MNRSGNGQAQLRERTRQLLDASDTPQTMEQLRALLRDWLASDPDNADAAPVDLPAGADTLDLILRLLQLTPLSACLVRLSDLTMIAVSKAFLDDFGYMRDEVIGRSAPDRMGRHDPEAFHQRLKELVSRGHLRGYPLHYRTTADEERTGLGYAELLDIHGEQYALMLIVPYDKAALDGDRARYSERFQRLFNESPDTFLVIAADRIVECNPAAVTFFGADSIDQIVGISPGRLSPLHQPDGTASVELAAAILAEVRLSGRKRFEWLHQRFDGTPIWAEVVLTMIPYGSGEAAFASLSNITDRVQARRQLEESEERYRLVLELSQEGLWDWNLTEQAVVCSPSYFTVLGLDVPAGGRITSETLGIVELLHPDDRTMVLTEQMRCITGKQDSYELEYRMRHTDGRWRWIFGQGKVVERDHENNALRIIGTHRDITTRKQDELALQRQTRDIEALFRIATTLSALNSVDEILMVLSDLTHSLFYVDAVMVTTLNETADRFVVRHADGVLAPIVGDSLPANQGLSGRILAHRQPILIEDLLRHPGVTLDNEYTSQLGPVIMAPLIVGATVLGALGAARSRRADLFNADDVRLLATLGAITGSALQRASLSDQAFQRLERLQALHQIDLAIARNADLQSILRVVLREAMRHLDADLVNILLLDPARQRLYLADSIGISGMGAAAWRQQIGDDLADQVEAERRQIDLAGLVATGDAIHRGLTAGDDIASYHAAPMVTYGATIGVLEVIQHRPVELKPEWNEFLCALAIEAAIAIERTRLIDDLQRANTDLIQAYDVTIMGWSRALDMRDKETEGHSRRVTELTLQLARRLGLSDADLVHVQRGALLHDIGKMGVPDRILLKPGKLDAEERKQMERHAQLSYDLLHPIEYLRPALDIPLYHHEKWDGSGYPHGLVGEDIPFAARIFAIVDVWDALTNDRPYRPAWSRSQALDYIREQAGHHFDPQVVAAFLELQQEKAG